MLVFTVFSVPALAKPPGKRVAVLPPGEGTAKDAVITTKIATALRQQGIQVISGRSVGAVLGRSGAPATDGDWQALARQLKVDGLVESTLSGRGAKRRIEVVVHNGADGSAVGRGTFAAKGPRAQLAAAVARGFWKKLGGAIRETARPPKDGGPGIATRHLPPSETAPAEDEFEKATAVVAEKSAPEAGKGKTSPAQATAQVPGDDGEDDDDEPATATRKRAASTVGDEPSHQPPAFEVEAGGRVLRRVFQFTPTSAGNGHTQGLMPTMVVRVAWFPILHAGVFLAAEYSRWLQTNTNPPFPAGTRELIIGARGRVPLSFGLLGFSAAYFQHLFIIGETSDDNDALRTSLVWPNVAYQGARLAASGHFRITNLFAIGVEAAYRLVTTPGSGKERVRSSYYFPNGEVSYGLDGAAFVAASVLPWLELRLAADYRRYAFGALEPGADNANNTQATGASDGYLGFVLSAVGVFGGK